MGSRLVGLAVAASVALTLGAAERAGAAGGNYAFDGGTAAERAQVQKALGASLFPWSVVSARARITIHILPGVDSHALPGEIFLDADLLDSGKFSWGVVQHEYAHQVDYFLLDDRRRDYLGALLGGRSWWALDASACHAELSSERFASTLAWAYWQSPDNSMRPASPADEAAAAPPDSFRRIVDDLLDGRSGEARGRDRRGSFGAFR